MPSLIRSMQIMLIHVVFKTIQKSPERTAVNSFFYPVHSPGRLFGLNE